VLATISERQTRFRALSNQWARWSHAVGKHPAKHEPRTPFTREGSQVHVAPTIKINDLAVTTKLALTPNVTSM
jgi:hypothetical protein